jgi:hypothetical protein
MSPPVESQTLSDAHWLQQLVWRKQAVRELKKAAREGDVSAFGEALQKREEPRLSRRKRLARIGHWCELQDRSVGPVSQLLRELSDGSETAAHDLRELLTGLNSPQEIPPGEICAGLIWLGWCPDSLPAETATRLFRCTLEVAQQWCTDLPDDFLPEQPLELVTIGELLMAAGSYFDNLECARNWKQQGLDLWERCLTELCDTDGAWQARWLPGFPSLIRTLARIELGWSIGEDSVLGEELLRRVQTTVERHLCLVTPGRIATLAMSGSEESIPQLEAALRSLHFKKSHPVQRLLQIYAGPAASSETAETSLSRWNLPDETQHSEWAEWGSMRTGWDNRCDQILVRWDLAAPCVDLVLNGVSICSGDWQAHCVIDGASWQPAAEWSCVCAFQDEEADYLELFQQDEATGITVVRQLLLNKLDRLILLGEIVKFSRTVTARYSSLLPWSRASLAIEQDALTPELAATTDGQRVRIFPIGLPQDRFAPQSGLVHADSTGLRVEYAGTFQELVCPIVLEAAPGRRRKPSDWRGLTIAEDGQIVSSSAARAYRLRIGREQWLYYHQLSPGHIPRSVLGHHTPHETVFARVTSEGEIVPLVQVETATTSTAPDSSPDRA